MMHLLLVERFPKSELGTKYATAQQPQAPVEPRSGFGLTDVQRTAGRFRAATNGVHGGSGEGRCAVTGTQL
jgi:hypothetical protein